MIVRYEHVASARMTSVLREAMLFTFEPRCFRVRVPLFASEFTDPCGL